LLKDYNQNQIQNKELIHFLPGNSFTPCTYQKILDNLSNNFLIKVSILRALWDQEAPPNFKNWDIFLNDYIESIKNEKNIIGIGHSIGGNILLKAAIKQPEKFDKIVLLDPTFFPPATIYAWKLISLFKAQSYFLSYIKYAENKKMHYNSIEEMFKSYRRYKIFSKFSDDDLLLLVKSLTIEKDGRIHLIFDSKWDAQIYRAGLLSDMFIWDNIDKLKTKAFIIRAEHSDAFYKKTAKMISRKNSNIEIKTIKNSDHLFPINNTESTISLIQKFLFYSS